MVTRIRNGIVTKTLFFAIVLISGVPSFLYYFGFVQVHTVFSRQSELAAETPRFLPIRPEVAHINCERLFANDSEYIRLISANRLKILEQPSVDMQCEAVRSRVMINLNLPQGFPVAHIRNVYKDYEFLEEQLAIAYSSENVYCFSVDEKAEPAFYNNMVALSNCIPNVIVSDRRFDIDSSGHFQNDAYFECLRLSRVREWKYALLIQNHDVVLRSDEELKRILRIMNGTNDVLYEECKKARCHDGLDRNLGHLGLCPAMLHGAEAVQCKAAKLRWGKGSAQALLARATIVYILDQMNVTTALARFNRWGFGFDELFVASLLATPELRIPGSFTQGVRPEGYTSITRYVDWRDDGTLCRGELSRHKVCLLTVEYLPTLAYSKKLIANKMMPDHEYTSISCLSQLIQRRALGIEKSHVSEEFYENLPAVRMHNGRWREAMYRGEVVDVTTSPSEEPHRDAS